MISPSQLPLSILILAGVNCVALLSWFIPSKPPLPPTFSSNLPPPTFQDSLRLFWDFGRSDVRLDGEARQPMSKRERVDFYILAALFSVIVGIFSAFTVEINALFVPQGYSISAAGNMSAGLIVAGIVGA